MSTFAKNQGLPGLPGLPSLPGLPACQHLPKNQGLPGLPGLPSLPGLPASQHLLKMKFSTRNQGLPGLPSLPGLPGLPNYKKSQFGLTSSLIWALQLKIISSIFFCLFYEIKDVFCNTLFKWA